MGGYECADHINRDGIRVNLLRETQHDLRVEDDYRMLSAIGIRTVREGICWSAVDNDDGTFDFSEVRYRMDAAEKYGIQQIWDLCHFGYPDGIFPTHPLFTKRFGALCAAFAEFHKAFSRQPLFVVPINEISFLSWHSGDVRGTVPFAVNSGWDIKYHLCKAAITGIKILKEADPSCTVILVEPLIRVHQAFECDAEVVRDLNEHQFQAMDIIAGRICPELGGDESLLEILGFNYYWNSEWEHRVGPLEWPETIYKRTRISKLLKVAADRYQKPIFLSETGHFGTGRIEWLNEVVHECQSALENGVDLLGICIYPVTDRPDWDDLTSFSNCGIWDLDAQSNRIPHLDYIKTIREHQKKFNAAPALQTENHNQLII